LRSRIEANVEARDDFVDRCRSWMADCLLSSVWRCWLAERNKNVIGSIWLQLIEKIPNPTAEPESYAYITNFFIIESERRKGLGSRLLFTALSWCKDAGVHAVILWPTEKSRSLYERFGFAVQPDLLELVIADTKHPSLPLNASNLPLAEK
jgi:GNAT superfamily N-acetyltransferase